MEIFISNVSYSTNKHQLTAALASILHSSEYSPDPAMPLINFDVRLFPNKRTKSGHSGSGSLTLSTEALGVKFLHNYGSPQARFTLFLGNRTLKFAKSQQRPQKAIVETIKRLPYNPPEILQERERRARELQSNTISIRTIQFGWECRDSVFSVEWEKQVDTCGLFFKDDPRELRIKYFTPDTTRVIAMRFSQINFTATSLSIHGEPTIFIVLATPPSFEREATPERIQQILLTQRIRPNGSVYDFEPRQRMAAFDDDSEAVTPYASLAIRLVCKADNDVRMFRRLGKTAQLPDPHDFGYRVEYRELFSAFKLAALEEWLRLLDFQVAFQVEALVRSLAVDLQELLELQRDINRLARTQGSAYTSAFLRNFRTQVQLLFWDYNESEQSKESVKQCFERCLHEFKLPSKSSTRATPGEAAFDCLHVTQTPTTMLLEGPFPERSNRVIRSYPGHQLDFLRVSFADENRLSYRFDREVNGRAFISSRVGNALHSGITVGGRNFEFLAYSQSALKEHSVWYIKPFEDDSGRTVDAASIIRSLGSFADLAFDQRLIYCPARYGARVSQAFTATESSVSIEVEELFNLDDVEVLKFPEDPSKTDTWCFTDGVGTMSTELARAIWKELQVRTRRGKRIRTWPKALQVRFMGSKGMLSIDHKLSGRAICLRPSMIKFDAPDSMEIEIAKVFNKPGRYFLNRPLIVLLEGLGVKYETFEQYQTLAVEEVHRSTESVTTAARFLEAYGLGSSHRMTSVLLGLHKLGINDFTDNFYTDCLDAAVHHVLRELKQHARIPVPGACTLVGIADIHGYLKHDQIFACYKHLDSTKTVYLEGPVLISRSPTIHPGDVQIAYAIGKPPAGSSFEKENLVNTVVFSIQGDRPLSSCLGGGDLDGDEYNLIPLNDLPEFKPSRLYSPALYDAAPKKFLDRPSTMADVADFFVDYISSDVLGIIAINWMIISDQSELGIFDPDCLKLGDLHSNAVDYPKSGQPVDISTIPKLKSPAKPDWNAPETVTSDSVRFYESKKAIGRLFRGIELSPVLQNGRRQARRVNQEHEELSLEELMNNFHLDKVRGNTDGMRDLIEERVAEFTDTRDIQEQDIEHASELFGKYVSELRTICASHTLSSARSAMLTEEEAMVGTIVAKCSQPRKRKDLMSRLREQTGLLVGGIREDIMGDEEQPLEDALTCAFVAWELSNIEQNTFGAQSFGWVALGVIFEAIKDIEDRDRVEGSRFSR